MTWVRSSTVPRVAVLTLAATGALSAAYQAYGGWQDRRRFPPPGRLVEVGGRRVHVWPAGNAPTVAPTVVVVPALATSGLEWVAIKRALGPDAAVVLYDRAGAGWSDPGPRPRTAGRIADELHQLLQAAGVAPPYLLVGHSLGGLVVRLYAARHPDRVAGVVLVDASHEDDHRLGQLDWHHRRLGSWLLIARMRLRRLGLRRLASDLGLIDGPRREAAGEYPPDLQGAGLAHGLGSRLWRTAVQELVARARSTTEARTEAYSLGELPVTVVVGGGRGRERWYSAWAAMQAELAGRISARSTLVVAEHAGHYVHLDDPDLVVKVIREQLARLGALAR
jgi:pimeloyl-ACP methyl ester carboxylesterase